MSLNGARIQTVDRVLLAQQVMDRLESAIREGRLRPGERLASERVLSERFGVSRPVLREALRRLQDRSLVTTRRGRGTYVRDLAAEVGRSDPAAWLRAHHAQVTEFYEARLMVEPDCAELAASRRTEEQLTDLKQITHAAERLLPDGHITAFTGLDIDFHDCVAAMSHNELLRKMLAVIIHPGTDLRHVLHRLPSHPGVAHTRHCRIARAIEDRDPDAAREAMRHALRGTLQDIERVLTEGG